ncbi:aldolase/citrate lyase family protein, partial [Roseovarius sp.]
MPLSQIALPLFLPATRLDRLAKAQAAGADAILLDLEDAVAEEDKASARAALRDLPAHVPGQVPVLVRLNAADSAFYA